SLGEIGGPRFGERNRVAGCKAAIEGEAARDLGGCRKGERQTRNAHQPITSLEDVDGLGPQRERYCLQEGVHALEAAREVEDKLAGVAGIALATEGPERPDDFAAPGPKTVEIGGREVADGENLASAATCAEGIVDQFRGDPAGRGVGSNQEMLTDR